MNLKEILFLIIWVRLGVFNTEKIVEKSVPQNAHEWKKEIQRLQFKIQNL